MTDQASKPKHILIVNQSAPYSSNARESLDLALAAATFEQRVSVLFQGDSCYQLLPGQASTSIKQKSITKMLKAFPVYGIEALLVDTQSLKERNIEKLEDGLNVRKVSASEIKALYLNASTVVRF
jgi:tRNA 2-thiouridine synthesizing protein C